jgi:putative transposase
VRLRGWDYRSAGAYFITIVTHDRHSLFGAIIADRVELSPYGEAVQGEWLLSADIRKEMELDEFIVMPNHLHGIVWIMDQIGPGTTVGAHSDARLPMGADRATPVGAHGRAPLQRPPRSLGAFVAGFKTASIKRINAIRRTPGLPVWQRNYYDRVIRDERELFTIREYIRDNPLRWAEDRENPEALSSRPR